MHEASRVELAPISSSLRRLQLPHGLTGMMSQYLPLTLGAEPRDCYLINEDALVYDCGTGPVVTNIASGQQVRSSRHAYHQITF